MNEQTIRKLQFIFLSSVQVERWPQPTAWKRTLLLITIIENGTDTLPALKRLFAAYQQAIQLLVTSSPGKPAPFEEATAGEVILLAVNESCIAGFVSIWLPDRFIHHLYVGPAYRQQGIALALMQAAINRTGLPAQLKCLAANTGALQLYLQLGFACIATGSSEDGPYQLMELAAG